MAIQKADDTSFKSEVLDSKVPVLLDFSAEWCGPCGMLAPILEKLETRYGQTVKFVKIDTDESPATARAYAVKGIPTLLYFVGGQPIDRKVGFIPEEELEQFIQDHLE